MHEGVRGAFLVGVGSEAHWPNTSSLCSGQYRGRGRVANAFVSERRTADGTEAVHVDIELFLGVVNQAR